MPLRKRQPRRMPIGPIDQDTDKEVFLWVLHRHEEWRRLHGRWTIAHYAFNIGAVGLTLTATILPFCVDQPLAVFSISGLATLFVVFLAFAAPSKQAKSYIAAWRLLDSKITVYRLNPILAELKTLTEQVDEGERILAGKDPY